MFFLGFSNEYLLEAMVYVDIPLDSFYCVISKYRLDSYLVESIPNFPFESSLIIYGSSDIGVLDSTCSTIDLQVSVPY